MEPITIDLVREDETKNSVKYSTDPDWIVGYTIYIRKSWLKSVGGAPDRMTLTLETALAQDFPGNFGGK